MFLIISIKTPVKQQFKSNTSAVHISDWESLLLKCEGLKEAAE